MLRAIAMIVANIVGAIVVKVGSAADSIHPIVGLIFSVGLIFLLSLVVITSVMFIIGASIELISEALEDGKTNSKSLRKLTSLKFADVWPYAAAATVLVVVLKYNIAAYVTQVVLSAVLSVVALFVIKVLAIKTHKYMTIAVMVVAFLDVLGIIGLVISISMWVIIATTWQIMKIVNKVKEKTQKS